MARALDERLARADAVARCGLVIVDVESGRTVKWLRFEHGIEELYDVAIFPGVTQAEAIGFRGEEIEQAVTAEG